MKIELLYFEDCPSHAELLPRLAMVLGQAGVEAPVEQRCIDSEEAAQAERFLGSPSLRIDGVDVEPGAETRTDFGLKCRLYMGSDGLSGAPSDELIRSALQRS